ncbi:MAG: hypothetical protein ACREDT_04350, partial [Methylocella sp.]
GKMRRDRRPLLIVEPEIVRHESSPPDELESRHGAQFNQVQTLGRRQKRFPTLPQQRPLVRSNPSSLQKFHKGRLSYPFREIAAPRHPAFSHIFIFKARVTIFGAIPPISSRRPSVIPRGRWIRAHYKSDHNERAF